MRTQGWTEADVRQQVLNVYNDSEVSSFSAVDLTSIMMYVMNRFHFARCSLPCSEMLGTTCRHN